MKKNIVFLIVTVTVAMLFVGCGSTANPLGAMNNGTVSDSTGITAATQPGIPSGVVPGATSTEMQDYADYIATQQKIAQSYDPNDPEATAKMMESYAELGSKMELREFENAESLDAPDNFPLGLIYSKGKITEASDSGDDSYINQNITIKTTDSLKDVKAFYKGALSETPWDITSQSSESDGASFDATGTAGINVNVYISSDPYSKIVSITVSYTGEITS